MLGRWVYYARRKAVVTLHGLRPSALRGRLDGPRVLVNSIPKSGTHLAERALAQFPGLRHWGRRTLMDWNALGPATVEALRGIRRGQFALAHLPAFEGLPRLLADEGICTLFVVRDPRAVLLSYCRYVASIDTNHASHPYFAALPDDAARLSAAIDGVQGVVASIDTLLERYAGWLDAPGVRLVRFERLVGPAGGGEVGSQIETLREIDRFLGRESDDATLGAVAGQVFSSRAPTFHRGRIDAWREHLTPEHLQTLDARAGDLMRRYGYELDPKETA